MKKSIQNKNTSDCPFCGGTKKVKVIIPIAQIGKYHLGKQVTEECTFCSPKYSKEIYEPEGVTLQ
tara:strand:- start:221 stop:415 length:195 start_codon:yes stop_codon:yes gene_type:complete